MTPHTIAATTHGRYLLEAAEDAAGLLVGFHGQGETAAIELDHLRQIRGSRRWSLVSVQGLHRYYNRAGDVVAAWMTREDRDLAIADNVAYVRAVLDAVSAAGRSAPVRLVLSGFSQGTAMAYRAAAGAGHTVHGLVILGGDLPPDVAPPGLPPVLLGRGTADPWYTADAAARDLARLTSARIRVAEHVFEGGHVRHPSFAGRAGRFLDEVAGGRTA